MTSLKTLIFNHPCSALLIFSFLLARAWFLLSSSFRFLSLCPVWSHLTACSLLLPRLLSSSHGDVRSAALDSGLGTSACLVKFCLHCEVFSHIAAFRSLARKITPLCVWLFAHVFGNPLKDCEFIHILCIFQCMDINMHMYYMHFPASFLDSTCVYEYVNITEMQCVPWVKLPLGSFTKSFICWITNELRYACFPVFAINRHLKVFSDSLQGFIR